MVVFDRVEGETAVLLDGKKCINVALKCLSPLCRQGDVVEEKADGIWYPNLEQTQKQRQITQNLLSQLYQNNQGK